MNIFNDYHRKASVYPSIADTTTLDKSIPDPEEQESVSQVQSGDTAPAIVPNKDSIWFWLGLCLIFVILFNSGG